MIGGYTGFMHGFLRFIICSFCISTAVVNKSIVDRLHSFIGGICLADLNDTKMRCFLYMALFISLSCDLLTKRH